MRRLETARIATVLALLMVVACNPAGEARQGGDGEPVASSEWPVFRGDPGLSGTTTQQLADTMVLRWSFATGDEVVSTPVVAGDRVFVSSADGALYALDLATGTQVWKYDTTSPLEASPLVVGELVVVGALDGVLHAVERTTGTARWTYTTEGKLTGSAARVDTEGGVRFVVGSYDSKLHCVDGAGQPLWTFETSSYINGAPAVYGSSVVFGGCDALLHRVSVADGTAVKEIDVGSYVAGSPAVAGNHAVAGTYDGVLVYADLEQGTIAWEYETEDMAPFMSSAAIADDMVVVGSRDGGVHCLERATGTLKWRFQTQGDVDGSPVIARDRVVVGSADGRLYMLHLETGAQVWSYEIGEPITGSPAVASGLVLIGATDGRVYAFGATQE